MAAKKHYTIERIFLGKQNDKDAVRKILEIYIDSSIGLSEN